jgi:AAA-like domain/TIR domain
MNKVFISYRHVKPDEDLASSMEKFLRNQGLSVFLDTKIECGIEWANEIDQQLRTSQNFVVLLSKESIRSPMVSQEVKLAHELRRSGKLRILPIRVDFVGELPYELASYLNPLQYVLWTPSHPLLKLCEHIAELIRKNETPVRGNEQTTGAQERLRMLAEATETRGAPLPAADLRLETGTIGLSSPFYIRRNADRAVERLVVQEGQTIVIKGSRQVGKSSLLARALKHARDKEIATFYLDFQLIDSHHLESLGNFFKYLAIRISRNFRTQIKPADIWDELLGEKDNITDFIEKALLNSAEMPVIFVFDEVDRVFRYGHRDDFFATLRGWHNNRATRPSWAKLSIVIAHAVDPILWIQDLNQSPFNIGNRIRLANFSTSDVQELNARHGSPLKTESEIDDLVRLVGGQPYLTRLAMYWLSEGTWTYRDLRFSAADDNGPFGDYLRSRLWALRESEGLRNTLKVILRNGTCEKEDDFQSLIAAGLVKGESRHVIQMSCDLYRDYLEKHL